MKNAEKPKCQHFRCSHEVEWNRSCYDTTSLCDGFTRYKGICPNCGTNYLHDADKLDALLKELKS